MASCVSELICKGILTQTEYARVLDGIGRKYLAAIVLF
jgi:hypothetical protein